MTKPNILIFMTDQQRGDTVLKGTKAIMPNINKFAIESLIFSNAHTVSPHCCPARASFFTGLYPSEHGVWNNVNVANTLSRGLYENVKLWSEDLSEVGYNMIFSGKWHISDLERPEDRGFKDVFLPREWYTGIDPLSKRPSMHEWKKFENILDDNTRAKGEIKRKGYPNYHHYGIDEDPFSDRPVVDYAIEQIKKNENLKDPWCMFVGTLGPHDPYLVPSKYLEMYNGVDIELPKTFNEDFSDKPNLYKRTKEVFDQLTEEEHKEAIKHYLAFCSYEDDLFGEVLNTLEKTNQSENTVVIFLSDHGDYMGSHGLWCKGLPCFKEAYHIPAIIKYPKKTKGTIIDELVSISDFAPTILNIAGIKTEDTPSSKSLFPFILGNNQNKLRDYHFTQTNGNELYGIQRSVLGKDFKFIYNGFDYDELYDLENDPLETINVINKKEFESVRLEMSKLMWKFAYETNDTSTNPYIMVGLSKYGPGMIFDK